MSGSGQRLREGRLLHVWKDGEARVPGFLDDHACLGDGLLTLYETTFEQRWWDEAMRLGHTILERFHDPQAGFFDTPADGEALVVRPKDLFDNATPSGPSAATDLLLRLAALSGDHDLERAGAVKGAIERAIDERLRQKFFPEAKQSQALNYAVVRDGKVVSRRTLVQGGEGLSGEVPSAGRFQVTADNRLFVFYYASGQDAAGKRVSENRLMELHPGGAASACR